MTLVMSFDDDDDCDETNYKTNYESVIHEIFAFSQTKVALQHNATHRDKLATIELCERLDLSGVGDVVRRRMLRWFEHLFRKHNNDWVKACQFLYVEGRKHQVRSRKTWSM